MPISKESVSTDVSDYEAKLCAELPRTLVEE